MHIKIKFPPGKYIKRFTPIIGIAPILSGLVFAAPDTIQISATLSDTTIKNSSSEATGAVLSALCPTLNNVARTGAQENLLQFCNALNGADSGTQNQVFDQVSSKASTVSASVSNLEQSAGQSKTGHSLGATNSQPNKPSQASYSYQTRIPLSSFLGSGGSNDWDYFYKRINTFSSFDSSFSEKDETVSESGFESWHMKFLFGADYRINNKVLVGTAITLSRTGTDLSNNRGSADSTGFNWMAFALHQINNQWSINGSFMLQNTDYDNTRNVSISLPSLTNNYSLSAESSVKQTGLLLGSAYQWQLPNSFEMSLLNNVNVVRTKSGSYKESGNTGFELAMNAQDIDNISMENGLELRKPLMQSWGVVIPQVNLMWMHQFADQSRQVDASFIHDPQANLIAYSTEDSDSDYFSARFGAVFVVPNGINAFVQIATVLAYQNYSNTTFSMGLRGEF